MIPGERIVLRPVEGSDHADIQRWVNDEDTWWWSEHDQPASLQDVVEAEAKAQLEGHPLIVERDGRSLGRISLSGLRLRDRRATLEPPIGEAELWTDGVAEEAVRTLVGYAFATLNLHLIELTCAADDERTLSMLERVGFRREADLRDRRWRRGDWVDHAVLSVTREDI